MSLESGRKLGLTASLIYVIMPIIAVVGVVALVLSIIAATATRIGTGRVVPDIFGGSFGLTGFVIALAVISIVGFILFMVAMYRLSIYYSEPRIFKNVLYAFILNAIGGIVSVGVYFAIILSAIGSIPQTGTPSNLTPFVTQLIISYLALIGVTFVFGIINGLFYMRAFNKLKEKSGVDNFGTAGLLFLIGAIIPVVAWIAWIFAAMGFRNLNSLSGITTRSLFYPSAPLSNSTNQGRCPNCGRENRTDSLYCSYCGKPMQ